MKGSPILEVPTIHSGSMPGGLHREIKGVRLLLAFVSLFCPASSCVFLDRVLGSGSHQPQLCKALPFWEILLPFHLLAYPSSPWHSPSLHQDLESPLQEPRESSPALTDCHKWPDVYMSTSLVWPPYTFLGLAIHDTQMPHQLLFLILACTLTSHGPLTKERLFFLWEGDALKRNPVEVQPKTGVLGEGNAHLADLIRELNPSDPWNKGNQH